MDKINLAFALFKNEKFKCKHELEEKILNKISYLDDDEIKKLSTQIINYQIDKYGSTLYLNDYIYKEELENNNKKARNRNKKRKNKFL